MQLEFCFSVSVLCERKSDGFIFLVREKLYEILLLERRQRFDIINKIDAE